MPRLKLVIFYISSVLDVIKTKDGIVDIHMRIMPKGFLCLAKGSSSRYRNVYVCVKRKNIIKIKFICFYAKTMMRNFHIKIIQKNFTIEYNYVVDIVIISTINTPFQILYTYKSFPDLTYFINMLPYVQKQFYVRCFIIITIWIISFTSFLFIIIHF